MASTPSRADTGNQMQAIQNALMGLQGQYTMDDPQWYALGFAWRAVRLAWYVVMGGNDGGKLEDVQEALASLEREL